MAKQLAKENNKEFTTRDLEDGKFGLIDRRISQFDPSDLRGIPDLDGEVTRWKPPNWLPRNEDGAGIMFFDELNLAPPSIQSAAYQLILDRELGEYRLPDNWSIISAGNRIEDNANVFDLASPLLNRFTHVELMVPTTEKWTEWAMEHNIDQRIISFLNFKRTMLMADPEDFNKKKVKAFPTPRSWEFCSKYISGMKDRKQLEILASTAVGEGAGRELSKFLKLRDTVDLDDILRHPEKIRTVKETSMKYATLSGLVEKYHADKELLEKLLKVGSYIEQEFRALLLKLTKAQDKTYFSKQVPKLRKKHKGDTDWIKDLSDYLV